MHIALVARLAVGLVFARSALGKLLHPIRLAEGIAHWKLVPPALSQVAAIGLACCECCIAGSHLLDLGLRWAVPMCLTLLAAIACAVVVTLIRGVQVPCLCFDLDHSEPVSLRTLARVVLLSGGEVLVLATISSEPNAAQEISAAGVPASLWVLGMACAIAAIASSRLILRADGILWGLHRRAEREVL